MTDRVPAGAAAKVLKSVPYFAELDETTLAALARAAVSRSFSAGQVVFLEGEPCAGLYVVEEGRTRSVMVSHSGRELVVRVVGPGEAFNEVAVLAGGVNLVTVEALEPTRLWVIEREALLRLMEEHPPLARAVTQNMAQRVLHLIGLVGDLSLRTVEGRLARLLLKQAVGDSIARADWSTQGELAARLGTVRDVINRAMRALVEEGVLAVDPQGIRILNREALLAKASADR